MTQEKLCQLKDETVTVETGLYMVKTQFSLSDNPDLKGALAHWTLNVRDVLTFGGAGFVVPMVGRVTLMPGTGSSPGFTNVDADVETGIF